MAHAARPVPAWKRLGLKLKHGDQSGDAVPDITAHDDSKQPIGTYGRSGAIENAAVLIENGKPAGLGKRKHQHDAAEDVYQTPKKNKKSEEKDYSTGAPGIVAVTAPRDENDKPEPLPKPVETGDKQRPKGDTNYRKKKGPRTNPQTEKQPVSAHPHHESVELDKSANQQLGLGSSQGKISHEQPRSQSPSPGHNPGPEVKETLLPSTESASLSQDTPRKRSKKDVRTTPLPSSPSRTDRRKSVTFTPDTKTVDGNSASNLFKKWVSEQKGTNPDFSPAEVAQFAPPPKVHPANGVSATQEQSSKPEKKAKSKQKKTTSLASGEPSEAKEEAPAPEAAPSTAISETPATKPPKGKKKDPSIYLSYLSQYHNDHSNWKFNKAKQNDIVDNALNIFRIPDSYSDALFSYIKGLKGAGVIARLKQKCEATLKELDEADQKDPDTMGDIEARNKAREEALEDLHAKEKKRRHLDEDIETLVDHPYPEGYIRRLKRRRADRLLLALGMAHPDSYPTPFQRPEVIASNTAPPRVVRKRKSRTEVSSDESSSSSSEDSSSEEESSDESSEEESEDDSSSEEGSDDHDSSTDSANSSKKTSSDSEDGSSGTSESGSEDEFSSTGNSDSTEEESDEDSSSESSSNSSASDTESDSESGSSDAESG